MEQIEIILRTTDPAGKVTEQLLARFDTEKPATESDEVLQYSGLCIDPVQHQVSYQGKVLPLTETYEFQTFVYLASQPDVYKRQGFSSGMTPLAAISVRIPPVASVSLYRIRR